jgi:DNA-directed RNA polymerase subunit omega
LAKGEPSTIENAHIEHEKPTVLALREIADRSIDNDVINAVDRSQRERREREALEWAAAEVVDDDLAKAGDE